MSDNVIAMRVPIIGEKKAVVHQILVTVIASCGCGAAVPVILPNVASVVACEACGDELFLQKLAAEGDGTGDGRIDISLGRLSSMKPLAPN